MKKFNIIYIAGIFALMSGAALNAQVTIGTAQAPNSNAVLELKTAGNNKGFLPPRIALVAPHNPAPLTAHVEGMIVYNTTVLADSLVKGLYINNGTQWTRLRNDPDLIPQWFYMPSIPIPVSNAGTFTVNLWSVYKRQFDNTAAGALIVSSNASAPKPQPKVYEANELDYYVTGYDDTVFDQVSLSPAGVLSYRITSANLSNVSDSTFMNIVFVVK
jgi:hypothetical protein